MARTLLLLGCVCWGLPALAAGDSCLLEAVAGARSAYKALSYAAAVRATDDVENCHDGSAAELAEAFRWRAQALAAQGEVAAAVRAFTLLATVSPDYALDPFLSPKVHELFQSGRVEARQHPRIFVRLLLPVRRGSQSFARAEIYGAPNPEAVFHFQAGPTSVDVPAEPRGGSYEAPVPGGVEGAYSIRAHRTGEPTVAMTATAPVTLFDRALTDSKPRPQQAASRPPEPLDAQVAQTPRSAEGGLRRKAWIPAAVGAVALIGGTLSIMQGNSIALYVAAGDPRIASLPDADAKLSTARTFQTGGAVVLGVGAAVLAAAGGMYFWGKGASEAEPRLSASLDSRGAALGIRGRF